MIKKGKDTKKQDLSASSATLNKNSFSLNTNAIIEKAGLKWISKVKVIPIGIFSFVFLLAGIMLFVNYNVHLEKSRQNSAYLSEMKQLTERVKQTTISTKNVEEKSFIDLNSFSTKGQAIISVLEKGGKISQWDKEIDPIDENFNDTKNNWSNIQLLINKIKANQDMLLDLKKNTIKFIEQSDNAFAKSQFLQQSLSRSSDVELNVSLEKIIFLSQKIPADINSLFLTANITPNFNVQLNNDMTQFARAIISIERANNSGVSTNMDKSTVALQDLKLFINNANNLSSKINAALPQLIEIRKSSLSISQQGDELIQQLNTLDEKVLADVRGLILYRNLSLLMVALSIVGVGLLALVFYERSMQTLRLAKILEKNQTNEIAANVLLTQMRSLDMGDFTKKIYVDDKYISPIAERVNKTKEIMAELIKEFHKTSTQIFNTANTTEETSKNLLQVSNQQYSKMGSSITKVGKITSDMDEVAQGVWEAKEESKKAKEASQQGEILVKRSIEKYEDIRNTIQESSKKIKKVGESAQEITEITKLIQDITKQINVLALNAAIQAASSGQYGREFTVLAQEVQRLAFDSEAATSQIGDYIGSVQEDMYSAIASMEKLTVEVVEGSKLNDNAGRALHQIETLTDSVSEKVSKAASKIEEKSAEMVEIALEMKDLQSIAEMSSEIVKSTALQVEQLKRISEKLNAKVTGYKV